MIFPQGFLDKYQAMLQKEDFEQFINYCQKPLRKSIRVNTLKISVADFQGIAQKKGWELEQIPWCKEGFWIEREDREEPLGNSIEHFLGLFYIQEASSMLPPEILNPKSGEIVLDMAAAPGSKTTQLAMRMENQGLIVANEPVVKRIKGLASNLERLGVSQTVVSRKEGQFFGENVANFFDKILLDAPCTGEGTVRKDAHALENWSQSNIEGMAKLQKQLIKSAFEALKPGGEMVYSTCTLALEENQEVVQYLLKEFNGNAELVKITDQYFSHSKLSCLSADRNLESRKINHCVKFDDNNGMLTMWPQMFDSEGFFVAKIKKNKSTAERALRQKFFVSKYKLLRKSELALVEKSLEDRFGGTLDLDKIFQVYQKECKVYLCPKGVEEVDVWLYLERRGLEIGEFLQKRQVGVEFKINHLGVQVLGNFFQKNMLELQENQVKQYLKGMDLDLELEQLQNKCEDGLIVLFYKRIILGKGLLKEGKIKNQIPRYLIW